MLKTKILACAVNNLSDARFFAAWGVQRMSFSLDGNISIEAIKEITDWIEGPIFLGQIEGLDSSPDIIESIIELGLESIVIPPFFNGYLPPNIQQVKTFIFGEKNAYEDDSILKITTPFENLTSKEIEEIRIITTNFEIWLDMNFRSEKTLEVIDNLKPYGLIIKGGEEERPGFKSFDDLDEIFESLEKN